VREREREKERQKEKERKSKDGWMGVGNHTHITGKHT